MREMTRIKKLKKHAVAVLVTALFFIGQFWVNFPYFSCKAEGVSWTKISSFTTWYSQKDVGRCENIELAASFLDGIILQPFGEFSFNQTVGERNAKKGYKNAKIIVNGEYVQGVGGGVCQVSTTLYNAALLSGMSVTEFHPHSLAVGYVDPSRDAMVSTSSDLKFFNPYDVPVKLKITAKNGGVFASFYSKGEEKNTWTSYKICTCVLARIPPPERMVRWGEEDKTLQEAKEGIESEAYLERYENGRLADRKRIRKDIYSPIREIIVKKIADTTKKLP